MQFKPIKGVLANADISYQAVNRDSVKMSNYLHHQVVLAGMMLGFPLSLLFFMDQNIAESMVNSPDNKLVKGTSYHWDMMVVGVLLLLLLQSI